MNINTGILFFVVFLLLCNFVISSGLDSLKDSIDENAKKVTDTKEQIEEKKWDYLSEQWGRILLKNKIIAGVDNFFKKINIVFRVLIGEDYSLSFAVFFALALWFYFLINFNVILRDYSFFSSGVSFGLSFCVASLMAQTGIYRVIYGVIFKLLFYKGGIWSFIWFFILLVIFVFLYKLNKMVALNVKKSKEKFEKEQAKTDRGILHRFVNAITKGLGKKD